MKINDFKLECHFGKYEFTAPYLLTQSDCESMTTKELLALEPNSEKEYLEQWLGYTETWGNPELRQLIAKLYSRMQLEDILVFHGAQEAIFAYMNVVLEEGDHMISLFPNYQSIYEMAKSIPNCELSMWNIKDEKNKWTIDFNELEALIKPNTKLIAISSPNNPTGYTFTNDEMKKLCELCKKHDLYLFADEVYKGLELDGEKRQCMADYYDKCVSLGVMSKAYGLAGIRVGWLATKDHDILEKIVKFKHYLSICDSAPSEFLAKIALKHGDKLLKRNLEIVKQNIVIADEFFDKYTDIFEKKMMMAGPVAYHKLLIDMPVKEFCRLAVEKNGVLLLSSDIYDMEGQYFRMGYGRKNMKESLDMFEKFIKENII